MAEKDKKYYWLKLKRDFFKRHDIRIIEEMPNGKDYILFYLKLLLESIDHEGNLRFSDAIPYNEQMLSVVTNTNIDIVRSAMKIFLELKMMDILDDQTIYMTEVDKLIGSESSSAARVRKHRENQRLLQCNTTVTTCNTEIELEKEIDKDKELETEIERDKDYLNKKENKNIIQTDSILDRVMNELRKILSFVAYQTFFEDKLKCEGVKGNKLVLSTGSAIFLETIDSNYSTQLNTAIVNASEERLTGYVWEV